MQQSEPSDIIATLYGHRRTLLFSMLLAAVVSSIVLLMMPNYYRATALFYPISESLQQPIVDLTSDRSALYGDDSDVDRMLSIAKSSSTRQQMVKDLDLYTHYDLDPSIKKDRITLIKKMKKYYEVLKTEYDAISISYEDTDPDKAAHFANTAMEIIDRETQQISTSAREKLRSSMQQSVSDKNNLLQQLTSKIHMLKEKYNIYDVDRQAEAIAMIEARSPSASSTQRAIDTYTAGVSEIKSLEIQQERLAEELADDTNVLSKLTSQTASGTALHIIERATAPDIKSRPHRSLLVIASMIIMGLLVSSLLVLLDSIKSRHV